MHHIINKFMFRRAVAISFLILANIVLLAVAVVPHHHHGDMICFATSHCHHGHDGVDKSCCHHDTQQPLHSHEHSDANCCNVDEWLLPNIEPEHKHQHHCLCTTCNNSFFVAVLPDLTEPTIPPAGLPFRQTPTTVTYLCIYVSQTLGLRAPPCC